MLRKLALLLAIAAFTLASTTAFGVVWRYYGDCPPTQRGSCGYWNGTEYHFTLFEGTGYLPTEVVDDPDATDGKALRILDDSAGDKIKLRVQPSENIDGRTGATAVARIKTLSESVGGASFGLLEYGGLTATVHWGGPSGHLKDTDRGGDIYLAGDTNYHIIRVTSKGTTSAILPYNEPFTYADGNLNGNGSFSGTAASEIAVETNTVKISGGAGGTTAARAFDVTADGSGAITVNVKIKSGALGSGETTFMWELHFLDTDGKEFGFWYGKNNTAVPRLGGTVLAEQALTGGWDTLQMKIYPGTNLTEFFFNGASLGTLDHGPIGNKLGGINFTRKDNLDAVGDTVFFDDLEVLGTTTTRVVNVYFDENPIPAITLSPAIGISQGVDSLMIGSGSTGGMEDVYFDWVYGTTDGAFAPGEEVARLGFPLVPAEALVTTVPGILTCPANAQIKLTNALVSCPVLASDYIGYTVPMGFGIQESQCAGVRVLSDYSAYPGQKVTVTGSVGKAEGETVIFANTVAETDYPVDPPRPVAMNNKAMAGDDAVANTFAPSPSPLYRETFSYSNSVLNGRDGWTGDAGSEIAVDNGALKLSGGYDAHSVTKALTATDLGTGVISVSTKLRKGFGSSTFWILWINDAAGANLGKFYGTGDLVRGRVGGGAATPQQMLTGGWDTVRMDIDITTDQTHFYFNGVAMGTLSHSGAANAVGSIKLERIDAPAEGQYLWLDDVEVRPSPTMGVGLSNVGLYTTIYGKVTAKSTGAVSPWDDYFYIDDGSGLQDGSTYIGIKCRPSSEFAAQSMPEVDDMVSVTGLVGIREVNGVPTRYFWTWNWKSQASEVY